MIGVALRDEIADAIRACPFECGWAAARQLPWSHSTSYESRLSDFAERCRVDLVAHLVEAHGAIPQERAA